MLLGDVATFTDDLLQKRAKSVTHLAHAEMYKEQKIHKLREKIKKAKQDEIHGSVVQKVIARQIIRASKQELKTLGVDF